VDVGNLLAAATSAFSITPATTGYTQLSTSTATFSDGLTLASFGGFSGSVALTCSVVATGTATGTCSVAPTPVLLPANGSAASTLSIVDTSPSNAAGTLTVTVTGTSGITSVQSTPVTVTINAPSFTITPTGGNPLAFTSGATTGNTEALTLTSTNGFAGTVSQWSCTLSATTAFYPPTCSVSPSSVVLTANGTATATVSINSTPAVTAAGYGLLPSGAPVLWRLAAALAGVLALLPLSGDLRRRRCLRPLAAVLFLFAGLAGLSGCGNSSTSSTPATPATHSSSGSYVVTVTATGTNTGSLIATSATSSFSVTIN
jgi:hypothetical protein